MFRGGIGGKGRMPARLPHKNDVDGILRKDCKHG